MSAVKTAISIDSKVFRRVERLARKLRISRSQFFGQAAKYMIEKNENLELIQKINAAYQVDGTDKNRICEEKNYNAGKVIEKW